MIFGMRMYVQSRLSLYVYQILQMHSIPAGITTNNVLHPETKGRACQPHQGS